VQSEASAPPAADPTDVPFRIAKEAAVASFERAYLGPLIERCHGNVSQAARAAKMDRMYLHQLAHKYGFKVARRG
jgi:DNA-binding NtrC family response regulator